MWLSRRRRQVIALAAALVLLALLAWLDYVTGNELALSAFYLIPITVALRWGGRGDGYALAVLSAVVWFVIDLAGGASYGHPFVASWNALMLLVFYLVIAFLLSSFQSRHEDLERVVAQRTAALRAESAERQRTADRLTATNVELTESRTELARALEGLRESHEELKRTQWQLVEAAKLESIGQLAAGIAHEVKNPLAILGAGVAWLQDRFPAADEEMGTTFRDLDQAVVRADSVISGLLEYSAPHELELRVTTLPPLIERALQLVKHELSKAHVRVVTELDAAVPALWLDPNRIQQVLLNVFTNAAQAMADGGTLTVTTRRDQFPPASQGNATHAVSDARAAVVIEVADTGPGVPPELLDRIFEPFYTTKSPTQGTGLGLTVCRRIVELHEGRLLAANGPGGGLTMSIWFPA